MFAQLASNIGIPLKYANRHGLITGPTGTGKTVSILKLIESFSAAGVPVFAPDVKGDLTAISRSCLARLLDPFGGMRVPLHAFGPDLLARSLGLTDAQAGCLEIAVAHADRTAAPLDTLEDARHLLAAISEDPATVSDLGHVTRASVGTIQRALLRLESEGAAQFFGPATFDIESALEPGLVSILKADRLLQSPRLYGAFLLYLLRDLQTRLPEVGDMDCPRLVFVFDEAHTLFSDCPGHLLRAIEATARLIRSKGVGIYFASQSPEDVPTVIRDQCATRLAHARELGVGRANFSTLSPAGEPTAETVIKPDLPQAPLDAAPMSAEATEAPLPGQGPDVAATDMSAHGYAFLAVATLALALFAVGVIEVITGGHVLAVAAVALGAWLALRT